MYYRFAELNGNIYSIDRFTFDFYFQPDDDLAKNLKATFNLLVMQYRQEIPIQSFEAKKFKQAKTIYQFDHLHIEIWETKSFIKLSHFNADGEQGANVFALAENQCVMRLDFNPNKCGKNPVLKRLLSFLSDTTMDYVFSIPRVDYAFDVHGKIDDFYVMSRKMETFYGTTRYYGVRGSTGRLRAYDKRQEQLDKAHTDIGYELTRFEWEQRGNRDFEFEFDDIALFSGDTSNYSAALLQFVQPELINHALSALDKRTRKKLKDTCFQLLPLQPWAFEILFATYFAEYGLPMDRRRDWDKQFEGIKLEVC